MALLRGLKIYQLDDASGLTGAEYVATAVTEASAKKSTVNGLKVTATDGSTARTLADWMAALILAERPSAVANPMDPEFGAAGDNSTDDTAAVQAAIDSLSNGGTLLLTKPHRLFEPSPGATECLLISGKCINIINLDWQTSGLRVDASVPATCDIIRYEGTTTHRPITIRDLSITGATGSPGRHGIFFDATGSDNAFFYGVEIDHCFIFMPGSAGQSIRSEATLTSNSGGFAYSNIKFCNIESVAFINVGDNVGVLHNTIVNTDNDEAGIYGYNISGAVNFKMIGNVIATKGCHILWDGGYSPVIAFNELESPSGFTSTSPRDAMIDLRADEFDCGSPRVTGNSVSSLASTGNHHCLRLGDVDDAQVYGNRFHTLHATKCVLIDAESNRAIIGDNSWNENGTVGKPSVTNNGASTTIADKRTGTWTPSVSFGGGQTGMTYASQAGTWSKNGRLVTFEGICTLSAKGSSTGTATLGLLPFTPVGIWPFAIEFQLPTSGVGDTMLSAFAVNSTTLTLRKMASGTMTNLADTDFTANTVIRISGSYLTDSFA